MTIKFGVKISSRKDEVLNGIAGVEFLMMEPDKSNGKGGGDPPGRGVFRAIVTDDKLMIAGVTSDTGEPAADLVYGFFDNFE